MKRFLFLIIPLLMQACSTMYIPSSKSAPLLGKTGETQIEAGMSTNSVYLSGGYAFSEKYALTVHGNMSFRNFSKGYDYFNRDGEPVSAPLVPYKPLIPPIDWFYFIESSAFKHRYLEGSVGRYNMTPSSKWKTELFTGAGYGYAVEENFFRTANSSETGVYKNKYWLGFVQGNIGKSRKILEHGFSLRLAFSGFCFSTPSVIADGYTYYPYLNKDLKFNNIHVEPHAFLRFKVLKAGENSIYCFVNGGFSYSQPLKSFSGIYLPHGIEREKLRYTVFNLSTGISYRF